MIAYVGQTRAAALVAELQAAGVGECTQRGELGPRRSPWFYDCGAFKDHTAGRPLFDGVRWLRDLWRIRDWPEIDPPAFVVVPDQVAAGDASLAFSREWRDHVRETLPGVPAYLVVQDGMAPDVVRGALQAGEFDGLFVGGTLEWKLETGAEWVALAHDCGRPCHVGRVGTVDRVRWAREIGADSIDSCLPLWSRRKLGAFLDVYHGRDRRMTRRVDR